MKECPTTKTVLMLAAVSVFSFGCYYDVRQELYGAECPPAAATYTESIEALVSSECRGCHSGTNPGGGLFLTNYNEISTAALEGQLVTRVMLPGSDPDAMPPGNPLYHCHLDLINAWVAAGAPLN